MTQVCKTSRQMSRREQTLTSLKLGLQLVSSLCHQRANGEESRAVLPLFGLALLSELRGQGVAGLVVRRLLAEVVRLWLARAVSSLDGTGKARG